MISLIDSYKYAIIIKRHQLKKGKTMDKKFEEIKEKFINADLEEKIRIYTTSRGLTVEQFKELLAYFPIKHLDRLEEAVNRV